MRSYLKDFTINPPLIKDAASPNLGLVVVIPAFVEKNLLHTLEALQACKRPEQSVEVIVVINHSEQAKNDQKVLNKKIFEQTDQWMKEHQSERLKYHVLWCPDMKHKHAGVGLARKIGMDEACYRLEAASNKQGVIVGFDGDSYCQPNYLQAIEDYFSSNPKIEGASLDFEHPIAGDSFGAEVYDAIVQYELHLRYYIQMQRFIGFPLAYQTIGSSMAVRCDAYQKLGGMNKRKAGEDFYFLQKFIAQGRFGEITDTKVIPSPRISDRVPFGTGRAVGDMVRGSQSSYHTYTPANFLALKPLFECIRGLNDRSNISNLTHLPLPVPLEAFLAKQDFKAFCTKLYDQTNTIKAFKKRFYHWFNAFMLMKYLHETRDHYFSNIPVGDAAKYLVNEIKPLGNRNYDHLDNRDLLLLYRSPAMQLVVPKLNKL